MELQNTIFEFRRNYSKPVAGDNSKTLLNSDEWRDNICKCRLLSKMSVSSAIFRLMSQYCERRQAAAAGRMHLHTLMCTPHMHAPNLAPNVCALRINCN